MGMAYQSGGSGWNLVGGAALGGFTGGVIGGIAGGMLAAAAPAIGGFLSSSFSIGLPSLTMSGGALAFGMTTVTVTGAQIAGSLASAAALGGLILFARTGKSNGYFVEKYKVDHDPDPDHAHLKGQDGTNIRIDINGNPLPGEPSLKTQHRKAIRRLWNEFIKLFKG